VQRVAVPQAGREQAGTVIVDDHGPVDDLVFAVAVAVAVGDGEVVVSLAREWRRGGIREGSNADNPSRRPSAT